MDEQEIVRGKIEMVWTRSDKGRRLYREENNDYGTTKNKDERDTQEKVYRCVQKDMKVVGVRKEDAMNRNGWRAKIKK